MREIMIGTFFCLALCGNAAGAAIEKLENIRTAVRDYAIAEVGTEADGVHIEVGRLDPRLRLAACSHPLDTYFSPGARNIGHTTVGVRCDGPKAWSLYVPLHIDRLVNVAVAVDNLPRGHAIGAADVHYEKRSLARLKRGYFSAKEGLIGKITTRAVSRGAPYTENMVKQAKLVKRGERVMLSLNNGTVAVRVAGTALRDGGRGERIPVRNLSSNRVIQGVVHEPGLVLIGKPRAGQ